jgi:hypothetical protein
VDYHSPTELERGFLRVITRGYPELEETAQGLRAAQERTGTLPSPAMPILRFGFLRYPAPALVTIRTFSFTEDRCGSRAKTP